MIVREFKKSYGARIVCDFPGMDFERGRIYAVLGMNGSGKSTFAQAVAGIIRTDSGERPADGKYQIGYLPQKPYAFRMSTEKNILLGGAGREKTQDLMEKLGLRGLASKPGNLLSGGETAKMSLARMLNRRFDMLILDEPTSAMDMESSLIAEDLIRSYTVEENAVTVMITHSVKEVERTADHVLYFQDGKLVESGKTEDVLWHPKEKETKRFLEFFGV